MDRIHRWFYFGAAVIALFTILMEVKMLISDAQTKTEDALKRFDERIVYLYVEQSDAEALWVKTQRIADEALTLAKGLFFVHERGGYGMIIGSPRAPTQTGDETDELAARLDVIEAFLDEVGKERLKTAVARALDEATAKQYTDYYLSKMGVWNFVSSTNALRETVQKHRPPVLKSTFFEDDHARVMAERKEREDNKECGLGYSGVECEQSFT